MKKAKDLSRAERMEIGILLEKKYSIRTIAKTMNRSPNTISYEIRENSVKNKYKPKEAHAKARLRKRMRKLQWSKIEESPPLKRFIVSKLKEHWNPDEIAGYAKKNPKLCPSYVSKTAIYEWLRTSRGERYCKLLYSKRKRVKVRKPKPKRDMIPNRVSIHKRSAGIENRTRFGHWEGDTVVSKRGSSKVAISTMIERKSRLFCAMRVESLKPSVCAQAQKKMLFGKKALSITYDNGIENKHHEKLGIPTFFCDPYSSYQRGGDENGNKMLRRYYPKGTDFSKVTQRQIDKAVLLINKKPRKILGYVSAIDVATKAGIIK